jgi:hypothetical protein
LEKPANEYHVYVCIEDADHVHYRMQPTCLFAGQLYPAPPSSPGDVCRARRRVIRLHYHTLFASDTPISEATIRDLWRQLVGNGKELVDVRRYDANGGAVGYCLKLVGSPDGNISTYNDDLYTPERSVCWDKNAPARRRWRRQLERRANSQPSCLHPLYPVVPLLLPNFGLTVHRPGRLFRMRDRAIVTRSGT